MPSARQPAAALADRAERHVFERLGDLPAIERRVLALVVLADVDRAAASRETGLGEEEVGRALAAARRALRRTRAPLAGGSRCERAELLLSDREDVGLERVERKWLEIHLARCPRCVEHEELLGEAVAELRATFVSEPPDLPPAPEATGGEGKGRLRVVPPANATEPAGPPAVGGVSSLSGTKDGPRSLSPAAMRAAKIVAIVLAIAVLLAGLGLGIADLSGH